MLCSLISRAVLLGKVWYNKILWNITQPVPQQLPATNASSKEIADSTVGLIVCTHSQLLSAAGPLLSLLGRKILRKPSFSFS